MLKAARLNSSMSAASKFTKAAARPFSQALGSEASLADSKTVSNQRLFSSFCHNKETRNEIEFRIRQGAQ